LGDTNVFMTSHYGYIYMGTLCEIAKPTNWNAGHAYRRKMVTGKYY